MTEDIKDIAIKSALAEHLSHPLEPLGTHAHRALVLGRLLRACPAINTSKIHLGQEALLLAEHIDQGSTLKYQAPKIILTWLAHVAPKFSPDLIDSIAIRALSPHNEPHPLEVIAARQDVSLDPATSTSLQLALAKTPEIGPHTMRQLFRKNIFDGTSVLAKELAGLLPESLPESIPATNPPGAPPVWSPNLRSQYIKAYIPLLEANNLPEEIEHKVLNTAMFDMHTSERDGCLRRLLDKPTVHYSTILILAKAMYDNSQLTAYLIGHKALEGHYELTKKILDNCNARFSVNSPVVTPTVLVAALLHKLGRKTNSYSNFYLSPPAPDSRDILTLDVATIMRAILTHRSSITAPIPIDLIKPLLLAKDKDTRIAAAGILAINKNATKPAIQPKL